MEGEVCRDTGRERSFTIPRDDKYLRWKTRAWVGGEHPSGLRANDGPLRRLHWRGGREEGTRAPQTTTANYRNEAHPMLHLFLLNKAGGGVEGWKVRTRSPLRSINAFPSSFSFVSSWIRQIFFSLRNKGKYFEYYYRVLRMETLNFNVNDICRIYTMIIEKDSKEEEEGQESREWRRSARFLISLRRLYRRAYLKLPI